MKRILLACVLLLSVTACQPKMKEVPTYRYPESRVVQLSAYAHAKDIGGYVSWIAPTGSMKPLLQDWDYVVISSPDKDPYENIQAGDVVSYDASKSPHFDGSEMYKRVMHRAVMKDRLGWVMSGDANAHTESKWRLTKENYLGRLVAIYRLDFTAPDVPKKL